MGDTIKILIPEEKIDARVRELGAQISKDYEGRELHMISILKGSVAFSSELAKRITVPVTMDYMSVSSYGNEKSSSGVVKLVKDLDEPIEGRHVMVVEDIVDSGRTLSYLLKLLGNRQPASLTLCTMLDKPACRVMPVHVDYTGFEVPDVYIVGYGLDAAQKYRNLPYIGEMV